MYRLKGIFGLHTAVWGVFALALAFIILQVFLRTQEPLKLFGLHKGETLAVAGPGCPVGNTQAENEIYFVSCGGFF